MYKLRAYLAFVVVAVVAASLFGAIHDQISYSVSSEYFTRFKFIQFQLLDPTIPERVRVAIIGILASWWMGIPLGLLSGGMAFLHQTPQQMWRSLLWSALIIVGFTLTFALGGLAYGFLQTQNFKLSEYSTWFIPADLENVRSFLCAGYMHNSAYLGGILAIPVAWIFHLIIWWRNRNVV